MIALIALGIGIYVALDGREAPKPTGPTERDRAIAIMNGETPPPEPTVVHAPQAGDTKTTEPASGTTAWRPAAEPVAAESAATGATEPAAATPTTVVKAPSAPIETTPVSAPATAPIAASEPARSAVTAEPIAAVTAEPIDAPADDSIAIDDIEIEPMTARPSKRTSRSSGARKAKTLASREIVEPKTSRRASNDPVLAILAEKPVKATKVKEIKADKPKKVKEAVGPATEIAAPKGAPPAKGTGKITITSNVAALIFLDGRATGKTAPSALVVPAGDHQITLLEPSTKKAKTASVQIAANKTVSVRRDFN
ncbi:MAG: PEGA domain-containing protein [Deltaproteobacteria bacterium]|nr:PEGA domain-containing protein [Deltaproteobacteria bacterium]